jgi:aminoglycoside/choline kinase family phosphotransferase
MNANEMPERIYLFDYNDAMVTPLEGDTIYVMEDAFMEKAEEYLYKQLNEGNMECGDIKTFIDEFRKYMKAE